MLRRKKFAVGQWATRVVSTGNARAHSVVACRMRLVAFVLKFLPFTMLPLGSTDIRPWRFSMFHVRVSLSLSLSLSFFHEFSEPLEGPGISVWQIEVLTKLRKQQPSIHSLEKTLESAAKGVLWRKVEDYRWNEKLPKWWKCPPRGGRGTPWIENERVSKFLGFKFLGCLVSCFLVFLGFSSQSFKETKPDYMLSGKCWSRITNFPASVFWKILIQYSRFWKY